MHTYNFNDPSSLPYDPEYGGLPLQNHNPPMNQAGNTMGAGNMGMGKNMGNMNMNNIRGHMNIPPPICHILNTLQQQAQETRDPIMQNLQGMLTNVLVSALCIRKELLIPFLYLNSFFLNNKSKDGCVRGSSESDVDKILPFSTPRNRLFVYLTWSLRRQLMFSPLELAMKLAYGVISRNASNLDLLHVWYSCISESP